VFAAHELAGIADDAMRLALMGLARDESVDRFVRTAVIEDIGESRSRQLTEPLLGLLSDPSALEYVRRAAADALGSLGDPQTVPHLVQLWRSEPGEQRLRARALLALGHIGTEPALREIIDVLASPSVDRNLRRALAEVLRPSGTSFDAEVLDRACRWLRQTDIPGAMLTVIARFSAEAGRDIFPEEAGIAPFRYRWAQDRSC
jgi:HEAT repeat protein